MGIKDKLRRRKRIREENKSSFANVKNHIQSYFRQLCVCFLILCIAQGVHANTDCPCTFCGDTTYCQKMGLTKVPPSLNKKFTSIKRLLLHSNKLISITNDSFINLQDLAELDLHENEIIMLESRAFEGLNNLENLHLSGNLLTNIPRGLFSNLQNLKGLFLDNNKLTKLTGDIFFMNSISNLNVAQNEITFIPWHTWLLLPRLKSALISQNPLTCDCNLQEMIRWLKTSPQGMSINTDVATNLCIVQNQTLCGNIAINGITPINAEDNGVFVEQSTAVVQCVASGNPQPIVVWKTPSGEFMYPYSDTEKYKLTLNGTLTISDISKNDEGFYACYAQHAARKDAVAKGYKLKIKPGVRPSISPEESVVQGVKLTNVTLKCEAKGLPKPSIEWYHPGSTVPLTEATFAMWNNTGDSKLVFRNKNKHLIITMFKESQAGVWRCTATNYMGTAESKFKLEHVDALDNTVIIIIVVVVCIVVIVLIAVIVALLKLVRQRQKQEEDAQKNISNGESAVVEEGDSEEVPLPNITPEKPKVVPEEIKVTPEQSNGLKQPFEHEPEVKGIRI